ncbi:DUF805 domain-containing protein [Microvirga calopogonii]|uniref:DUF805 domain-containing protein n=1 Tax=Microvirga calopogonii TaxID=2078013 RepID=UPI000E0DB4ED|nr:DUF805 domain-containing protein [Microvirga calopogonii]
MWAVLRFFFSFQGRIGRLQFLYGILFWAAALTVAFTVYLETIWFCLSPLTLIVLVAAVSCTALQVKRFHDRNRTGWRVSIFCILFLTTAIFPVSLATLLLVSIEHMVELLIMAGTRGPNHYGPAQQPPPEPVPA